MQRRDDRERWEKSILGNDVRKRQLSSETECWARERMVVVDAKRNGGLKGCLDRRGILQYLFCFCMGMDLYGESVGSVGVSSRGE